MESDSNSPIDQNPNPNSPQLCEDHLNSLSLNESNNVVDGDIASIQEGLSKTESLDSEVQMDEKLTSLPTIEVEEGRMSSHGSVDIHGDRRDESSVTEVVAVPEERFNTIESLDSDTRDEAQTEEALPSRPTFEVQEVQECSSLNEDILNPDVSSVVVNGRVTEVVAVPEEGLSTREYLDSDIRNEEEGIPSLQTLEVEEVQHSSSLNEVTLNRDVSSEVANGCVAEVVAAPEVVEEVREIYSSSDVQRVNSEVEFEDPSSPSSSGYAGGMGSSNASISSEIEEVEDGITSEALIQQSDGSGNVASSSAAWIPGKRHVDEDDASLSWRKRKKHFFVLSHSGKPIYSRHGDEHKLAGFSATLQAIISFVENGGDRVKFVRAGKHQVVFLVKGPIYLVCISCTEEPYEALRGQLELIYGQILLILTKSINRCFERNSKFDMTPLLGGTDAVFSSLIHSFSWNPAAFLHAYTCLPLAYPARQAAGAILQDVADSGVLFAILMCKHKVISLVGAQKASLHPDDMLLLANFVLSSESFRTSESFSPICLPRYNPMAFLYAYVHYLDVDTYLILLTTSSDAFYHLKDCRIRIEMVLLKSNVLSDVQRSILEGGLRVEDLPCDSSRSGSLSPHLGQNQLGNESPSRHKEASLVVGGPAGLWHFIYRSINLDQYVSSEFSSPINGSSQQKRLYRAYQSLYSSMHEKGTGPHKTQFRRDENYVLLCWITQDFELYAAFDPLADKALAIKTCNWVCKWVRDVENEIFLLGASPFSW